MLNEHITRGVLSAETRYIDGRYLRLDFTVDSRINTQEKISIVLDWVYDNFIEDMSNGYAMDKYIDGPTSRKTEIFKEAFMEGYQRKNWCEYDITAYKKASRLTSLKKIEDYRQTLFEKRQFAPRTAWDECVNKSKRLMKGTELLQYLFNIESNYLEAIEGMYDIGLSICHSTNRKDYFQLDVSIGIAAYSLHDVDKAAEWLESSLLELAKDVTILRGSLNLRHDILARYGTDEWSLFEYELSSLSETLWDYRESNYISSFEWLTILPPGVISDELLKIVDADEYAKIKRIGSNYVVTAGKPVSKHKREFYKGLYENLAEYMSPGFSKMSIYDLRPYFEDLWVPEKQYAMQGETVYFLRGNFDYIKDVDQSDYWYGIYLECCDAIKEKEGQ